MTSNLKNSKVDLFIENAPKWREEIAVLREILLDCGLCEDIKWGKPCYVLDKSIIALIIPLKEYCMLSFPEGVLMKNAEGILVAQTENVQSARVAKFTSAEEIARLSNTLRAYVAEAVQIKKSGLKPKKSSEPLAIPEELQVEFDSAPAVQAAFEALTPGR